jgi:hypothetical protein
MTAAGVKLRAPFKPEAIGKLPKPYRKDSERGNCPECGGYHGLPAVHLDYVGHAAVTDRLLEVDPAWTWEPVAFGPDGLPAYDKAGGLWIRLTVDGVTRFGYGDGPDPKQRIGDAIRNAAMRFGVALDLWTKDELESQVGETAPAGRPAPAVPPGETRSRPSPATRPVDADDGARRVTEAFPGATDEPTGHTPPTQRTMNKLRLTLRDAGVTDNDEVHEVVGAYVGREISSLKDLTPAEASDSIKKAEAAAKAGVARSQPPLQDEPF